jgi:integrase
VFVGKRPGSRLINLQSSWRRLCTAADLDCIRLHDLRHTYASLAVGQGFSLALTGALLAHSSTKTTERYAHLQNDHVRRASEHLGSLLDSLIGMKAAPKSS